MMRSIDQQFEQLLTQARTVDAVVQLIAAYQAEPVIDLALLRAMMAERRRREETGRLER